VLSPAEPLARTALVVGYLALCMLALGAVGLFFSTLTDSPPAASLGVLALVVASAALQPLTRRRVTKLCRLRYGGSAHQWGFAIYRASHDDYAESVLPTGLPVGTCEDALDTACGLYLGNPTAWN
jgi:hypothetical protein